MPKRIRSHQLEDLSRSRLHRAFEEVGWTVEDLQKDYGEDLLVRIFENGQTTPISFFVQIKATDGIHSSGHKVSPAIHYPVKTGHLIHWRRFHQPVIVTLWDAQSDRIYWNSVNRIFRQIHSTSDLRKRKSIRIPIPRRNLINGRGLREIRKIAYSQFEIRKRESESLALLIEVLQGRFKKRIEYSPGGIIYIDANGRGGGEFTFFGKALKQLTSVAEHRKVTLDRALQLALENLFREIEEYDRTGTFPVRNLNSGKIEYKRMTKKQLKAHINGKIADLDCF